MAHNRTTQFSAPFRRNNLLGLPQYTASEYFPTLGKWDRARTEDLYVVRGTEGRTQPVQMIVIGAISSDKANLQPHGNYDPTYMPVEQIGKKAKLQFVLTSPEGEADFVGDYNTSLDRLRAVQEEVAGSPNRRDHFIEGNNMKMNFHLFDEKGPGDYDSNDDSDAGSQHLDISRSKSSSQSKPFYEVSSCYQDAWDSVGKNYFNNVMEVYGTNELPIDYRNFEKFLRTGALVAVTFTLKHYSIRERGSTQIGSDTYCASIKTVSILREAEKKMRRAFNSKPPRRPVPVPQFPTRSSQKLAADTFAPVARLPSHNKSTDGAVEVLQGESPGNRDANIKQNIGKIRTARTDASLSSLTPNGSKSALFHPELLDQVIPLLMERMKRRRSPSPNIYVSEAPSPLTELSDDQDDSDDDDIPPLVPIDDEGAELALTVAADTSEARADYEPDDCSSWVSISAMDALPEDGGVPDTGTYNLKTTKVSLQKRGSPHQAESSAIGGAENTKEIASRSTNGETKSKSKGRRTTRTRSSRSEGKKARV